MTTRTKKEDISPKKDAVAPKKEEPKPPVNIEVQTPDEEPTPAPEATPASQIQTDVREKLSKRSDKDDPFVPSNPVALEKAAKLVAEEKGFEFNRGTSIGARLLARANRPV